MKVDIWSDVRCPFCYIGKRKFEKALQEFENSNDVEVNWRSFQLDPNLQTRPQTNIIDYFTKTKGISREEAIQMFAGAGNMAKETGLDLNLESSVLANSFKAHQLLQFGKSRGKGDETKEALFKAHFIDAVNIDDTHALLEVAENAGLDKEAAREALATEKFAGDVKQDEMAAQKIGVRGVPFFVFDNKYGVSGAQPTKTFLEILERCRDEAKSGE